MKIKEIGFVAVRKSSVYAGSMIYRHTFLADGFELKDNAFTAVHLTEQAMGDLLGGSVILSCKTQEVGGPSQLIIREALVIFTLEISHDPVQGPAEDPLKFAGTSLSECLKELSLNTEGIQIEAREWDQLISFESSIMATEILSKLRENDNRPTQGDELVILAGHITRLNKKLKKAGFLFEIRSIEPGKKGMWSQRFRLVRTV